MEEEKAGMEEEEPDRQGRRGSEKTVGSGAPSSAPALDPTQTGLSFDRWSPRGVPGGDIDPSCKVTRHQASNAALPRPPGKLPSADGRAPGNVQPGAGH